MRSAPLATLLLAIFFTSVSTTAQEPQKKVSIDKLMTAQERQETGISSLTTAQRAALNRWLNVYTLEIRLKQLESCSELLRGSEKRGQPTVGGHVTSEYNSTGSGHWIKENGDGKIITLEDGSIWQISDFDQIDTALWLPITDITVLRDTN